MKKSTIIKLIFSIVSAILIYTMIGTSVYLFRIHAQYNVIPDRYLNTLIDPQLIMASAICCIFVALLIIAANIFLWAFYKIFKD